MSEENLTAKAAKYAKESEAGPTEDHIGRAIVHGAFKVHSALGPGLLEGAYEACLVHELATAGLDVRRQVLLPINYNGVVIDAGYRLDLLVDELVVVGLKAVDQLLPVHTAQVLSYLKLGGYKLGFLINFNVTLIKEGIRRVANKL